MKKTKKKNAGSAPKEKRKNIDYREKADLNPVAVNSFLNNYSIADEPLENPNKKTKGKIEPEARPKKTSKKQKIVIDADSLDISDVNQVSEIAGYTDRSPKNKVKKTVKSIVSVIALSVLILAVMRVGFYFYAHPDFEIGNLFKGPRAEAAEIAEKTKQVESDFEVYQDYMNAATGASSAFCDMAWASSGDALSDMIKLVNVGMPSDRRISLSSTYSYAVGGMDPWGTPYFFTAKKLRPGAANSGFEFYVLSAGPNCQFDVSTFTPDDDDIFCSLLATTGNRRLPGVLEIIDDTNGDIEDFVIEPNENEGICAIVFNPMNGDEASSAESTIGTELPAAPVPVQDGLIFRGYYNKPNGEGVEFYDENGMGTRLTPYLDTLTLYAFWFDPNAAEPTPEPTPVPTPVEQKSGESQNTGRE